jgi:hypothetical protein
MPSHRLHYSVRADGHRTFMLLSCAASLQLTAHMNASYQARDGLPPGLFPGRVPVYLGHYHYPHTLPGTSITYIGSPFQGKSYCW